MAAAAQVTSGDGAYNEYYYNSGVPSVAASDTASTASPQRDRHYNVALPPQPQRAASIGGPVSPGVPSRRRRHTAANGAKGHLELCLDLDHTLVHAVELGSEPAHASHHRLPPGVHTFSLTPHDPQQQQPKPSHSHYKIKLREGTRAFLREVAAFCTVHVHTHGSQSYTREVLRLIDPHESFINGLIRCRPDGDAGGAYHKSIDHLFPRLDPGNGGDPRVPPSAAYTEALHQRGRFIILDDRDDVWDFPSQPHVLKVPAFRCWSAEDGGTLMPTPSQPDTTLVEMLDVLKRISAGLESAPEPSRSVPYAKDSLQRTILAGTVIIFSGGLLRDPKRLDQCTPWRIAQSLGAQCELDWESGQVTHVVSGSADSAGVMRALDQGLAAVSLQWLLDCHARWHRQDETLYALQPQATQQTVAAPAAPAPAPPPPSVDPMTVHVQRAAALTRQSLPEGAGPTEIMSAAIIFLAPAGRKDHARALLARFEAANHASDVATTAEVLDKLQEIVGIELLSRLLVELGVVEVLD